MAAARNIGSLKAAQVAISVPHFFAHRRQSSTFICLVASSRLLNPVPRRPTLPPPDRGHRGVQTSAGPKGDPRCLPPPAPAKSWRGCAPQERELQRQRNKVRELITAAADQQARHHVHISELQVRVPRLCAIGCGADWSDGGRQGDSERIGRNAEVRALQTHTVAAPRASTTRVLWLTLLAVPCVRRRHSIS